MFLFLLQYVILNQFLQSSDHDSKHGSNGKATIGVVMANKVSTIPKQESITTKDGEIRRTEPNPFSKSTPVANPLRHLQCQRVSLQSS